MIRMPKLESLGLAQSRTFQSTAIWNVLAFFIPIQSLVYGYDFLAWSSLSEHFSYYWKTDAPVEISISQEEQENLTQEDNENFYSEKFEEKSEEVFKKFNT